MIKKEAIATENNDLAFEHAVEILAMVKKGINSIQVHKTFMPRTGMSFEGQEVFLLAVTQAYMLSLWRSKPGSIMLFHSREV